MDKQIDSWTRFSKSNLHVELEHSFFMTSHATNAAASSVRATTTTIHRSRGFSVSVYVFPKQKIVSRVNKGERKFVNSWIRRCTKHRYTPSFDLRSLLAVAVDSELNWNFHVWHLIYEYRKKNLALNTNKKGWKIGNDFLKIKQKILLSENSTMKSFPDRNQFFRSINKSESKCATRFIYDDRLILFNERWEICLRYTGWLFVGCLEIFSASVTATESEWEREGHEGLYVDAWIMSGNVRRRINSSVN